MDDRKSSPELPFEAWLPPGQMQSMSQLSGPVRHTHLGFWLCMSGFAFVYCTLFALSRFPGFAYGEWTLRIAQSGLEVLPFLPLILLATLGRDLPVFRMLTLQYWLLLAAAGVVFAGLIAFGSIVDPEKLKWVHSQPPGSGVSAIDAVPPGGFSKIIKIVLLCSAAVVVGLCCFNLDVRRLAARWTPIDPDSFPDAVGLATLVAVTLGCLVPLIVLHNPPAMSLAQNAAQVPEPASDEKPSTEAAYQPWLLDLYSRILWTLPVAFLAAGYPLVRNWRGTLKRLGLVVPSLGQLLFAPLAAVLLIGLMFVVDCGIDGFWKWAGFPITDEKAVHQLLRFATSGAGALAIGVSAGICEELTFRGLLQPRLGLWPANLLFAAVHATQYQFDGLLKVFLIGLVLGRIRERTNTTTSALVHGLFDFLLMFAAAMEMPGFTPGK